MNFLSFLLGMIFVIIISPLFEYLMGYIHSKYEIAQLKDSVKKAKLQEEIMQIQSPNDSIRVIGFSD